VRANLDATTAARGDAMEKTGRPLRCRTAEEWRSWLERNHDANDGVWLMIGKKGSKIRLVTLAQATEEALCFGWIDSAMRPVDDEHFVLRYTPRRTGSNWSARNVALAERLIEEGRMTEAGLAEIDAAKRSGRWEVS
jgi:uncharacterized protein YdeI (YjbR/CyaY-like superfamily)